jgi:hypothetical protein
MQFDGIPNSITRSAYLNLVDNLGLGQFHPADILRLTLAADVIRAEVIAKDTDGQTIVNKFNNDIEVHIIVIPVVAD